ncbi:MAG: ribonuclease P protein component [Planctomycetes bacterium]|nr:ribonuclease P protein component [Planctomycetota bacterium]
MTSPRHLQKFPKTVRVRSRLDFDAVYERGLRVSDGCLSLIVLPNGRPASRLGLAVSKRSGNSVQRNQLKRLLREAFRLSQADLPTGLDLVVQPRTEAPIKFDVLRQSLASLASRAVKKLAGKSREPQIAMITKRNFTAGDKS